MRSPKSKPRAYYCAKVFKILIEFRRVLFVTHRASRLGLRSEPPRLCGASAAPCQWPLHRVIPFLQYLPPLSNQKKKNPTSKCKITYNFSDFNIITLTRGDIKLKLLIGKLAKSIKLLENSACPWEPDVFAGSLVSTSKVKISNTVSRPFL